MKKASKIISVLMVAIMTLSIFAVSASAVATPLVAGNTKETATTIPNYGVEYTSELSKAGEQDWFKFTTLSEDAYYTIALKNYNITEHSWNVESKWNLNLYVYDTYNKEITRLYRSITNTNIKLEKNTTYYIKVAMGSSITSSTGDYEVFISYKLDPVSNNKEYATAIDVNNIYKYSLDGTGDSDWFSFTTPVDGTYKISLSNYNIPEHSWNVESQCNLNLFVYDAYNKEITRLYRNTTNANIELEKNTTYYIKVAMGSSMTGSTGNYGFSVNCDTASAPDDPTPPENPDNNNNNNNTGFDFMSILTAIWDAIVWLFNFLMGLVGAM